MNFYGKHEYWEDRYQKTKSSSTGTSATLDSETS